jgi:hypothetical protein
MRTPPRQPEYADFSNQGDSVFPLRIAGPLYLVQFAQGGVGWR